MRAEVSDLGDSRCPNSNVATSPVGARRRAGADHEPTQRRPGAVGGVVLIDPGPGDTGAAQRPSRRTLLAGVAGLGAAAAVAGTRPSGAAWPTYSTGSAPARRTAAPTPPRGRAATPTVTRATRSRSAGRISAEQEPGPTLVFPTAGEAAAATAVTVPTILDTSDPALHLLRRTTFGLTPELVDEVHTSGIDAWLAAQLDPAAIPDPEGDRAWGAFPLASADPATVRASVRAQHVGRRRSEVGQATLARQMWSRRQLFEVDGRLLGQPPQRARRPGPGAGTSAASYQRDVIRAHALGSFTDMLLAAGRHPAMLRYLTADQSTKDSVNENYGRELLELHTVGVASGYTEDGRAQQRLHPHRAHRRGAGGAGRGGHVPLRPGASTGSARSRCSTSPTRTPRPTGGLEVGDAYLRHLAAHPATAQTIARKLAVRFVSDIPPPALVDRLATAYLDDGTADRARCSTCCSARPSSGRRSGRRPGVRSRTSRPAPASSARRPRATSRHSVDRPLQHAHDGPGQQPLAWPAPNGYPDVHAAWRSAGGLVGCWNIHRMLVCDWQDGLSRPDPVALAGGADHRRRVRRQPVRPAVLPGVPARRTATRSWRSSAATPRPRCGTTSPARPSSSSSTRPTSPSAEGFTDVTDMTDDMTDDIIDGTTGEPVAAPVHRVPRRRPPRADTGRRPAAGPRRPGGRGRRCPPRHLERTV